MRRRRAGRRSASGWAVQIHGNRVFYSGVGRGHRHDVAAEQHPIRSVALDALGAILPAPTSSKLVVARQPRARQPGVLRLESISDISFSAAGDMLLAERSMERPDVFGRAPVAPARVPLHRVLLGAHERVRRRRLLHAHELRGRLRLRPHAVHRFVAGARPHGVSGDALHLSGQLHRRHLRPAGLPPNGGNITNSLLVDSDGDTLGMDKVFQGDVESPAARRRPWAKLCGMKWSDLDHDGVHDGGERRRRLADHDRAGPGGPYTATTGPDGSWCVDNLPRAPTPVTEGMLPNWVPTFPRGRLARGDARGGPDDRRARLRQLRVRRRRAVRDDPEGHVGPVDVRRAAGTTGALDLVHGDGGRNALQLSGDDRFPTARSARSRCRPRATATVPAERDRSRHRHAFVLVRRVGAPERHLGRRADDRGEALRARAAAPAAPAACSAGRCTSRAAPRAEVGAEASTSWSQVRRFRRTVDARRVVVRPRDRRGHVVTSTARRIRRTRSRCLRSTRTTARSW